MAVALDATMTAGNSSDGFNQQGNGITLSTTGITVTGSASLLVAMAAFGGGGAAATPGIFTWNGTNMTAGPTIGTTSGGNFTVVAMYYIINPAAGANTLTANWSNSNDCYLSATSFTGTDTSTGIQVADSQTGINATSITVPSTSDGATVAVFCVNGSTPTVNFTKIFATAPLAPGGGGSFTLGGSSNNHTFTGAGGSIQALAGIHILGTGASSGPPIDDDTFLPWARYIDPPPTTMVFS